jgi:hypothetical protein
MTSELVSLSSVILAVKAKARMRGGAPGVRRPLRWWRLGCRFHRHRTPGVGDVPSRLAGERGGLRALLELVRTNPRTSSVVVAQAIASIRVWFAAAMRISRWAT